MIYNNDLSSNCLHPQILLPTRVSGNSKTIIDMFSNIAESLIKILATGNITFTISDHLPQFFFHNFSFRLIFFFLIIINTREMLKLTEADLIRTYF